MSKKTRGREKVDENLKRSKFKRHTNKHHVYPTSRFTLKKNPALHTAWHDVFENLTPEEAIEKVKIWMAAPEELKKEIFENERKFNAWGMLFGEARLNEILQIIKKEWTFPGVIMIQTNSPRGGEK